MHGLNAFSHAPATLTHHVAVADVSPRHQQQRRHAGSFHAREGRWQLWLLLHRGGTQCRG